MSDPPMDDQRLARVALSAAVEPAHPRLCAAVQIRGAVEVAAALRRGDDDLDPRGALGRRLHSVDPESVLGSAHSAGARFVCPGDPEWPDCLDALEHAEHAGQCGAPFGLWLRGPHLLTDLVARRVAVVGSRAASSYGLAVAGQVSADLAERGVTVVSGAAYGIDAAAHRGALAAQGTTVAVLACGLDLAYPRGNAALIEQVEATGLLVSELPPGFGVSRPRLLARNRLVAALAGAVVVVEAAARSGALSTAAWADSLSLPVLGIPGPVTSSMSVGVHRLLRRGAVLVSDAAEILEAISGFGDEMLPIPMGPARPTDALLGDAALVFEALPARHASTLDELMLATGLLADDVVAALASLLGLGLVVQAAGRWQVAGRVRARR